MIDVDRALYHAAFWALYHPDVGFWLRAVWRLVGAGTAEARADAPLLSAITPLMLIGALSTVALYLLQGGIMGDGWADVWQPAVWQAVAGTRFGGGVDLADPAGVDCSRRGVDPPPITAPGN